MSKGRIILRQSNNPSSKNRTSQDKCTEIVGDHIQELPRNHNRTDHPKLQTQHADPMLHEWLKLPFRPGNGPALDLPVLRLRVVRRW